MVDGCGASHLVGDVVAAEYLGNAMAFDSATGRATRMLGPVIGGAVYQWVGLTGAYAIATGFYLAMTLLAVGLTPVAARRPLRRACFAAWPRALPTPVAALPSPAC